jgi:hypothetical protein
VQDPRTPKKRPRLVDTRGQRASSPAHSVENPGPPGTSVPRSQARFKRLLDEKAEAERHEVTDKEVVDAITSVPCHFPPKEFPVTRGEFFTLPPAALLAWLARCTRRILELFEKLSGYDQQLVELAYEQVRLAEEAAENGQGVRRPSQTWRRFRRAFDPTKVKGDGGSAHLWPLFEELATFDPDPRSDNCYLRVTSALPRVLNACPEGAMVPVFSGFVRDLDKVRALAREKGWDRSSHATVGPNDFDSLWPNGPPEGWPADEEGARLELIPQESAPPSQSENASDLLAEPLTEEEASQKLDSILRDLGEAHEPFFPRTQAVLDGIAGADYGEASAEITRKINLIRQALNAPLLFPHPKHPEDPVPVAIRWLKAPAKAQLKGYVQLRSLDGEQTNLYNEPEYPGDLKIKSPSVPPK